MSDTSMKQFIADYKEVLRSGNTANEQYNEQGKWIAIRKFQDRFPEIVQGGRFTAENVLEFLEECFVPKSSNLWTSGNYQPLVMLKKMAALDPTKVAEMFTALYDEDGLLNERIESFERSAAELVKGLETDKKLNHYQDLRAIMVYLTFRYPDQYFLYKNTMVNNFLKNTELAKPLGRQRKYDYSILDRYLEICAQVHDELIQDEELLRMDRERIDASIHYEDKEGHLLTQDFIFCVAELMGYGEEQSSGPFGIIMVNITWNSNDWKSPSKDKSGHKYVQEGNVAHESWNFDFELPINKDGIVHGFSQRHKEPTQREGGNNLVIFYSDGKIVGFYGQARFYHPDIPIEEGREYNITGEASLSLVLPNKIDNIKEKGYLETKEKMGQVGFIYLKDPNTAINMLEEALVTNPEEANKLKSLLDWVGSEAETSLLNEPAIAYGNKDLRTSMKAFARNEVEWLFDQIDVVVAELGLTQGDERVVYNSPKEHRLAMTIGQRYCLSIKGKPCQYGFILPSGTEVKDVVLGKFTNPDALWAKSNSADTINSYPAQVLESCLFELERSKQSSYRKHNNNEFERVVFDPAFRNELINEIFSTDMKALNTILYGPPGTGKTYRLKSEYFEKYTTRETAITKAQRLADFVNSLTWWEVCALVLIDLGPSTTSDIMAHELMVTKANLSNSKNVRATIWGNLQTHTVHDCELVGYKQRQEPLVFNKKPMSVWEVIMDSDEEVIAELQGNLERSKQQETTPGKQIERYDFVTFHQSFSYEDFIEGIKPDLEEGEELNYKIEPGVFLNMANRAKQDPDNDYAIFIDEINRGNISAIFGELISLIEDDKRKGTANEMSCVLPYSKSSFSVPSNLHIIGTMNTADRSIALLDTALRRRFEFIEMMPLYHLPEMDRKVGKVHLGQLLKTINERIEFLYDRDHTIGHAYLLNVEDHAELCKAFRNKIIPLLQEYFYGDWSKIELVLGDNREWGKDPEEKLVQLRIHYSGKDEERLFGLDLEEYEDVSVHEVNPNLTNEHYSSIPEEAFVHIYSNPKIKEEQAQPVE